MQTLTADATNLRNKQEIVNYKQIIQEKSRKTKREEKHITATIEESQGKIA